MKINRNGYLLISTWGAIYAIAFIFYMQTPFNHDYSIVVRLFALLGIITLFNATLLSAFLKQVYKSFGEPFLKIHHFFSILGLILISLHPIALALYVGDISVFLPDFSTWYDFWRLAGRPALIIIYVALVAILLKKSLNKSWRILHSLNYIALAFGVIHAVILGVDYQHPVILGIYLGYLIAMGLAFGYKRYLSYQRRKTKAAKRPKTSTTEPSPDAE